MTLGTQISRSAVDGISEPNKLAQADARWHMKAAWDSASLYARQKSIVTFSSEVALLIDLIRDVAERATGQACEKPAFVVNFGSPISDNSHKMIISLLSPTALKIHAVRTVDAGRLSWNMDTSIGIDTSITTIGRLGKEVVRAGNNEEDNERRVVL